MPKKRIYESLEKEKNARKERDKKRYSQRLNLGEEAERFQAEAEKIQLGDFYTVGLFILKLQNY